MQSINEWTTGPDAWDRFVQAHPELGYRHGRWAFHNFLRYFRAALVERDAIRLARRRFWVAHRARFNRACFDLATGAAGRQPARTPPTGIELCASAFPATAEA